MKIFLAVIVVALLIVVVDLLVGIVNIVTAPEGRSGNSVAAQRVLSVAEDLRGDSRGRGAAVQWSTGVIRC